MCHMASKHFIPATICFITRMAKSVNQVMTACPDADTSVQQSLLRQCSALLRTAQSEHDALQAAVDQLGSLDEAKQMAHFCRDTVCLHMQGLRKAVDALELIVDKDLWPVPTYGDLMFEV